MTTHEPPAAFSWLNLRAELTGKQARVLIDGASGTARRGRVLAIIGPSGAGKSTLLQALAGRLDRSSKLRLSRRCDSRRRYVRHSPRAWPTCLPLWASPR
mmetsp:Transcript_15677/g.50082  ORF Transcript_15677/g.50082 Transcript_15677/m.50082 type:complete len:100 (+) Transcript_15677:3-302(+)